MRTLLIAVLLTCIFPALANSPSILSVYPACDYQVLDSINLKKSLLTKNKHVDPQSLERAKEGLSQRAIELAQEQGAQGVILTKRLLHNVKPTKQGTKLNQTSPVLEMTFDLVGGCGEAWALSDEMTPLDPQGNKQIVTGSVGGWQKTITFDISGNYQKQEPALVNRNISFNGEAFGISLGMDSTQSAAILGQPSLNLALSDTLRLQSYGRNFWLLFEANQLIQLTSENRWINASVVNLIPFDDRFDNRDWILPTSLRLGAPLADVLALEGTHYNKNTKQVSVEKDNPPHKENQFTVFGWGEI